MTPNGSQKKKCNWKNGERLWKVLYTCQPGITNKVIKLYPLKTVSVTYTCTATYGLKESLFLHTDFPRSRWYSAIGGCPQETAEISFPQNEHNICINLNHRSHKKIFKAPSTFKQIPYLKQTFKVFHKNLKVTVGNYFFFFLWTHLNCLRYDMVKYHLIFHILLQIYFYYLVTKAISKIPWDKGCTIPLNALTRVSQTSKPIISQTKHNQSYNTSLLDF